MPRYFFHLEDGHCIADEAGLEMPGEEAAHRYAVNLATDLVRNRTLGSRWDVLVTDEAGAVLFRVDLKSIPRET